MELGNIKIQISDDSILARKQLKDILKANGCINIIEAIDGNHTVETYKNEHPDIVFMDIVMPNIDGVEAVRQIISFDPNAVIIMLSSVGTRAQIKAAIEAGAKDFIQKPIQKERILEVLNLNLSLDKLN